MKQLLCASVLALLTYATPALANSCSNVATLGTYDRSGIEESDYGINAVGTFRIEDEKDENKQPDFNLVTINCSAMPANFTCTMTQAAVRADREQPNTDKPNCTLDLDVTEYQLREVSPGVLSGSAESG